MIFYDNASTTKCSEECLKLSVRYYTEDYYNPSAAYHSAIELTKEIDSARETILRKLNGDGKIIFTASGSEGDNLAIFGSKKPNGARIISTKAEHAAVYNSMAELKQRGYDVVFCDTDSAGRVILDSFSELMTPNTALVSIMHVSNETGAINDIEALCKIAKGVNKNVIFHSDGVQAVGKIPVNLRKLGIDLYTFSGHKIHSPKGVGGLYVANGINLRPIIFGGGQEYGIRGATENVAGIKCLENAIATACNNISDNYAKVKEINEAIVSAVVDGDKVISISDKISSPYILTLALKHVRGEVMVRALEGHNVCIGTGSACSSRRGGKRIEETLNLPSDYADGIIRLSFSDYNDINEVEYFKNSFNLEYLTLSKYVRG